MIQGMSGIKMNVIFFGKNEKFVNLSNTNANWILHVMLQCKLYLRVPVFTIEKKVVVGVEDCMLHVKGSVSVTVRV
jgi:hypothetical protein